MKPSSKEEWALCVSGKVTFVYSLSQFSTEPLHGDWLSAEMLGLSVTGIWETKTSAIRATTRGSVIFAN